MAGYDMDVSYDCGLIALALEKADEAALMYERTDYNLHPEAAYSISIIHLMNEEKYASHFLKDAERLRNAIQSSNWTNDNMKSEAYHTLSTYYCGDYKEFGIQSDVNFAYQCINKAIELNPNNEEYKQEREQDYYISQNGEVEYRGINYELDYESATPEIVGYKEFARRLRNVAERIKVSA